MAISSKRLYNWFISLVAASCMVLYGYDASVFNSIQGSKNWVAWFNNPNAATIGGINTAYTVGAIVGGFFFSGPIADYFGRKVGMATGCVLVIIATFMQTFAPYHGLACFMVGRVLIGLGQGIALTSGPIYIGELAPSEIRGQIMTFWQMFYSVGSFICFWIAYACTEHKATLGHWDWKLIIIFQLLVPVIILVLLPTIPGSPRWYIKRHNDIEKARAALRRVRDTEEEVEAEILQIREAIEYENEAISGTYSAIWKDKSIRKRMYLALVLNAGQQLTGQGSLNSYSTAIYKKIFDKASTIALINALNATFGIIFTLNAVWIVDRFGRKPLLILGGIGMGICMIISATVETQTPTLPNGAKSEPVGIAIVALMFIFILFYKPSWGATVWIWTSEVFSMNVRAQAVGMASQTQNVANTIFQQFFPIFLKNDGFYAFYFFAAINFVLAIFVFFLVPETKKVTLEEIDALFGGANHVIQGEGVLAHQKEVEAMQHQGSVSEKPGAVTVEDVEHKR
ncbi:MFS-type Sugar/inositol transporter [Penicillium ucsense]|uniref:MFS-type Sugar/inositol transporter n=1 Tax=Penicillium ucsense TaxID=2839758 RepID=A0A8J8VYG7_9EURO|nr:MFS-type Sugar/inositol transporter [Penicillium ucsense]KAF7735468.1 MFS-type Sugar/inositol transporter [Penicillium ucsense]